MGDSLKKIGNNKIMYWEYIINTDRQLISEQGTFLWLSKGDQKAETESQIVVAQYQALQTKYYAKNLLNTETHNKCRLYQQFDETIHHISACPILAKEHYIKIHDRVCAQQHFSICKEKGVQLDNKHRYEHVPKSVETSKRCKVAILWNQQIHTDRIIPNSKPNIITVIMKREHVC